jgi:hypothetical protein
MNLKLDYKKFKNLCFKIFQFLTKEYNFELFSTEEDSTGYYIIYKNASTGIRISYEPREGGIFILIYRLIDDQIPQYEIKIEPDTIINSFYLDDIIELSSSDPKREFSAIFNPKSPAEEILRAYADALQKYAKDILNGDFKVFSEVDKIVKKRAQELEENGI